ncbi:hypothetical protein BDV06DRAFT_85892 [Aspergillus oleicola]
MCIWFLLVDVCFLGFVAELAGFAAGLKLAPLACSAKIHAFPCPLCLYRPLGINQWPVHSLYSLVGRRVEHQMADPPIDREVLKELLAIMDR